MADGEPDLKYCKKERQKLYNKRRGPRKPQFSLNFQFDFGEEDEMKAVQERFCLLRKNSTWRVGRANADF